MSAEKPSEKIEAKVKDVVAKVEAKVEEVVAAKIEAVAEKLAPAKDAVTAMGVKAVETVALTQKAEGTKLVTKP